MQTPLQLTFRGLAHSDALATHLQQRAEKLEQFFDRMISCHVVVELAGHHQCHGNRYHLSINVGLPGHDLLVGRRAQEDRAPEGPFESADRAFDEAERQLESWVTRQRDRRHEAALR